MVQSIFLFLESHQHTGRELGRDEPLKAGMYPLRLKAPWQGPDEPLKAKDRDESLEDEDQDGSLEDEDRDEPLEAEGPVVRTG
ncbi:unnamed protein product [Coccothraustes coccothraustes]